MNYDRKQATFTVETERYDEAAIIRVLEEAGYSCTIALTIEHALRVLQESRIDVIVADRFIGQRDFVNLLNSEGIVGRSGAQVILLTGDSEAAAALNAAGVRVAGVFTKPVPSARLRGAVASLIEDKRNVHSKRDPAGSTSQLIDWALLEEIIGKDSSKDGAWRLLLRFEDELLSDCMKCLRYSRNGESPELAALLHRMNGIAMLIGATALASKLTECSHSVRALIPSASLVREIADLDNVVLDFSSACRQHFSFNR